jgi:hypothetical protein
LALDLRDRDRIKNIGLGKKVFQMSVRRDGGMTALSSLSKAIHEMVTSETAIFIMKTFKNDCQLRKHQNICIVNLKSYFIFTERV